MASAAIAELGSHRALLNAVLPSLTCQICILLMHRPFALAPCGHVSCYSCLVSWFTTPPAGQAAAQDHAQNEVVVVHHPPAPAPHSVGANQVPIVPGPANVPVPPPAVARRKKTCPHCRAVVREKPVEVWSIKDMVSALVRSGLADPDTIPAELVEGREPAASSPADPWKDIFHDTHAVPGGPAWEAVLFRENMGILDEADGGVYRCVECAHEIWHGVCVDCGREYPGHRLLHGMGLDDDSLDEGMDDGSIGDGSDFDEPPGFFGWIPPQFFDSEDDDPSEDDEDLPELGHHEIPPIVVGNGEPAYASGSESDEEYESSFIDDDEADGGDDGGLSVDGYSDHGHSDGDHGGGSEEEVEPPLGLSHHNRHFHPVILSDEEDQGQEGEDEDVAPVGHPRTATRYRIASDDDASAGEDEEDEAG